MFELTFVFETKESYDSSANESDEEIICSSYYSIKLKLLYVRAVRVRDTVHSMRGKVNLLLRHSGIHFPPNSRCIACRVAELKASLCLDTKSKEMRY